MDKLLREANNALKKQNYEYAYKLYQGFILKNPELSHIIAFNIQEIEKKLGKLPKIDFKLANNKDIIIYTVNVGNYESVKEPLVIDPNVEYILFTDNKNLKSKYWKVIYLEDNLADPRRKSRLPKILAHKYLPPHDISVYIDSSLQIKAPDIKKMIDECMEGNDIALYKHYKRDCVYDEIEFVINSKDRIVDDKEKCKATLKMYEDISYPKHNGLFENAFIFRKNTPNIQKLNEIWWQEYEKGTERDQFVLMYTLWQTKIKPNTIKVGEQFRKNPYVDFYKHSYLPSKDKMSLAIVVHVFYDDVWEKIKEKLEEFKSYKFDLFITASPEKCKILELKLLNEFQNISFLSVENEGMDVFPFIKAVEAFSLNKYDRVLKLHTKNEKTYERQLQGEIIFSSLLNKNVFDRVSDVEDTTLGIFPGFLTRSVESLMYGNRKLVTEILQKIYLPSKGSYFAAGTMFWISGKSLNPIVENYKYISTIFQNENKKYQTGGDGLPAHAFERIFGILVNDECVELSFRIDSKKKHYKLLKATQSKIFQKYISTAGSTDHIYLDEAATNLSHNLINSNLFNKIYYKKEINNINFNEFNVNDSPAVHAIIFGDILGLDPCKGFSTIYYKLMNRDILRKRTSAIGHFLTHGKKENRKFFPTYKGVYDFLVDFNFIDTKDTLLNYKINFDHSKIKELYNIIKINKKSNNFLAEKDYKLFRPLLEMIFASYQDFQRYKRSYQNGDFIECEKIAFDYYKKYGETREAVESLSAALFLNKKFKQASELYKKFWSNYVETNVSRHSLYGSIPYDENINNLKNNLLFDVIKPNFNIKNNNSKICVYTALYGGFDELPPILTHCDNIDFICFSDREYSNPDWKIVVIPSEFEDNNLNAKRFKILPHKYLSDYDASIFVDANTYLYGNLTELIDVYLSSTDFAMFEHPQRDDIYREVAGIIGHKRHRPNELIVQLENYYISGFPHHTGMVEGSFIWRKHNNKVINSFMQEWWEHILKFSKRDQLSLGYLMWKNNLRPKILPVIIGDSRTNIYFKKFSHQESNFKFTPNNQKYDLVFLYKQDQEKAGSTVMRGFQLYELIQEEQIRTPFKKISNIKILNEKSKIKNSIVYLTKGYLMNVGLKTLKKLKKNNNILLSDFVDGKVNKDKIIYIDIMVAASISAFIDYKLKYNDKKTALLTHHVDPRIETICEKENNQNEKLNKSAYFGELVNTIRNENIEKYVNFYQVDTSGKDMSMSWMYEIPKYKYHYAMRRERGIDGLKPFTKGFTAACAQAIILTEKSVTDVKYYLGEHYPFYLDTDSDEIHIQMKNIMQGNIDYDTRAYKYISNLRNRSNSKHILKEFKKILNIAFEEAENGKF